jgi:hypothetical protein
MIIGLFARRIEKMSALKGFNGLLGKAAASTGKKGRVWAPSAERAAKHIDGIKHAVETGKLVISGTGTPDEKTRSFTFRDLVMKSVAALKAGATPSQIREAAAKMLNAVDADQWKSPEVRKSLMEFATEQKADLSAVAETFGLEDAGTKVVSAE